VLRQVVTGVLGDPAFVENYRLEALGDVLVERVVWSELPAPRTLFGSVVADSGAIWFRFWLPGFDQVVERYYLPDGSSLGAHVDLCGPVQCDERGCVADDYILDIWIDPQGRVTVHNEDEFDRAVLLGELTAEQAQRAEAHLRELTAAIARNRFPPPIVRNWQIDPTRFRREQSEDAA
jgi:predicted RNA-binding protein associated with RNAse of E/G family